MFLILSLLFTFFVLLISNKLLLFNSPLLSIIKELISYVLLLSFVNNLPDSSFILLLSSSLFCSNIVVFFFVEFLISLIFLFSLLFSSVNKSKCLLNFISASSVSTSDILYI